MKNAIWNYEDNSEAKKHPEEEGQQVRKHSRGEGQSDEHDEWDRMIERLARGDGDEIRC